MRDSDVLATLSCYIAVRHLALVLDSSANTVRGYLDGELFAQETLQHTAASISTFDCPAVQSSYVGFAHDLSGQAGGAVYDIRDLRMYTDEVPRDDEIRAIANVGREWCVVGVLTL